MKKIKRGLRRFLLLIILASAVYALLLFNNILWIGSPSEKVYPVRGVDVSHYQGTVDWKAMEKQDIKFAFLKATEGSGTVDDYFKKNLKNIRKTDIIPGAYHFFSFDSSAASQAANFIKAVPKDNRLLPPTVDVEFYGNKEKNRPDQDTVRAELQSMLQSLEKYYGKKPIIYTTMKFYLSYIKGHFEEYPLWIRNAYYRPFLLEDRPWEFWQYSGKEVLEGYDGHEKYIDMNIFNGSLEEFKRQFH